MENSKDQESNNFLKDNFIMDNFQMENLMEQVLLSTNKVLDIKGIFDQEEVKDKENNIIQMEAFIRVDFQMG